MDLRVRVPLMEEAAVAGQKVLTSGGRFLKPEERRLLLEIFGDSVNLDPVQIVSTSVGPKGRPYTLGNTIRVPQGTTFDAETLVHEMTHVWQFQTRGSGYISDSVLHQMTSGKDAYSVKLVPGQSFYDYAAEQQAMIVQRYYADDPPGWSEEADVLRMMAEIRKARPLSAADIQKDRWFGPGPIPDATGSAGGPNRPAQTVPLIRIEF